MLILVQRPQHKSASYSVGDQKNHLGAIFIEFGDSKKCHTSWGEELVQKRELRSQLHAQMRKIHSNPFGTIRNKFLFLKTTKNSRYVRSLVKNPYFEAYREAKRDVARRQVR